MLKSSFSGRFFVPALSGILIFLTASCSFFSSREVTTGNTFAYERRNYFRDSLLTDGGLSFESENFLRSNLLMDEVKKNPTEIFRKLREQYEISRDKKYLSIATDYCRWMASLSDEKTAVRFALNAIYYLREALLLQKLKGTETGEHDIVPFQLALAYNECTSIIFEYLKNHALLDHDSFFLRDMEERVYCFDKPSYDLSIPKDSLKELFLASQFTVKNLMLKNRRTGIGVPLVGTVTGKQLFHSLRTPPGMTIPVTMLIRCQRGKDAVEHISVIFIDTTLRENFTAEQLDRTNWPLTLDFSTPLACFLDALPERNLISVMLHPDTEAEFTGLYMAEPYHPGKIPVVFVHGLLSSPETWVQMINTLKNDPVIRGKYQFWYYAYSSGSPVLASAAGLRQALLAAQKELCTTPQAKESFGKMVIVGHSMGGLLTKMLLQKNPYALPEKYAETSWEQIQTEMPQQELELMKKYLVFPPLPFISRVIFMAVPHRGAKMAQSPIARFGTFCTRLPAQLRQDFNVFRDYLRQTKQQSQLTKKIAGKCYTGIDNLDPENPFIKTTSETPLKEGLIFHCIIGNREGDDQPGGSDGVVPYTSSHLDGAASEVIVRSGHSVHRTPGAIREVLRILRLHLMEKR